MHDLNALRRKIASARQEVRNLTRPAAGPAAAPRGAGQEPGDFGAGGGNGPAEASGSRPQDADPGQVTAPSHEKLPPSLIDKAGNIRLDKLNQPEDIDQVIRDLAARDNNFIAERRHVISDRAAAPTHHRQRRHCNVIWVGSDPLPQCLFARVLRRIRPLLRRVQ